MKKLFLLTAVFVLNTISLFSQLSGNGTSGNPYTGTVNSNTTWYPDGYPGGVLYASNITILSGYSLTVSPGLYNGGHVQFTGTTTLTIQGNAVFIVNPRTSVTVHRISNSGTLRLESGSNEAGVASLLHRIYSGTGTVETRLYLSGGTTAGGAYKWHYISSPIDNISASSFNTLNLAQYVENLVTGNDNYPGWVAYDGYQYSSGSTLGNTFSTLEIGRGYNYYAANSATFTLTGEININNIEIPVTSGTGYPEYQGYNLIGNPFASCLDWDFIIDDYTPAYVNDAIYFTNNGVIASYVNGVGADGGTGTIPPLQGFFVKATAPSSVYIPESARTHNLDQLRYKKKSTQSNEASIDTISLVRLKLFGNADSADLVVRFNSKATSAFDGKFDAYEFSRTAGDLNIWSSVEGIDYSINGLPYPASVMEIPIGANVKISGMFKLTSNEINRLDEYNIYLKDTYANRTADLKKGEYIEFTAPAGMLNDRFILAVTKSSTAIDDMPDAINDFSIYATDDRTINIRSMSDNSSLLSGSVTVYDLNGRMVLHEDNIEWTGKNDLKQIHIKQGRPGLYLVVVDTGMGRNVKKITLR